MKVAVASLDGTQISPHFGRSPLFLVMEVAEGKIVGTERRPNTVTAHARGECCGGSHGGHGGHCHDSIGQVLNDCQAVLCYGMGAGAAEALTQAGIQPFMLGQKCTPEQAVTLYLEGKLAQGNQHFCGHHS